MGGRGWYCEKAAHALWAGGGRAVVLVVAGPGAGPGAGPCAGRRDLLRYKMLIFI